eukprot:5258333-Pyramimonas_sp.AAC.1
MGLRLHHERHCVARRASGAERNERLRWSLYAAVAPRSIALQLPILPHGAARHPPHPTMSPRC